MTVRDATAADAPAIAELVNLEAEELYGSRETAAEIAQWFELPGLVAVVAETDGGLVGYGDLQRSEGSTRFHLDVREDPRRPGAAVAIVAELEGRAREQGVDDAVLRVYLPAPKQAIAAHLRERGYEIVRHSFAMEIELTEEPPPAELPAGIAVRGFEPGRDDERTYEAHMESFADHWGFERDSYEDWRKWAIPPDFDPALWLLAEDGDELAGICLNRARDGVGWVGVLGVRAPWRRRGLGEALLRRSFAELYRRGMRRVGLGVDAENTTGAVRLYERVGMSVARRSATWERPL